MNVLKGYIISLGKFKDKIALAIQGHFKFCQNTLI